MNLRVVDHPATPKAPEPAKPAPEVPHRRNPGFPLDLDWVGRVRMNRSALERRAATLPARRTVKKDWQTAWLLKAITLMDLTTLNSDDTPGRVERLCAKARHPVRQDILDGLGVADLDDPAGRRLRLPLLRQDRGQGARRHRHPGRRRLHRLPARPRPDRDQARARSKPPSPMAPRRSTSSSSATWC